MKRIDRLHAIRRELQQKRRLGTATGQDLVELELVRSEIDRDQSRTVRREERCFEQRMQAINERLRELEGK